MKNTAFTGTKEEIDAVADQLSKDFPWRTDSGKDKDYNLLIVEGDELYFERNHVMPIPKRFNRVKAADVSFSL